MKEREKYATRPTESLKQFLLYSFFARPKTSVASARLNAPILFTDASNPIDTPTPCDVLDRARATIFAEFRKFVVLADIGCTEANGAFLTSITVYFL